MSAEGRWPSRMDRALLDGRTLPDSNEEVRAVTGNLGRAMMVVVCAAMLLAVPAVGEAGPWSWKKATTTDDALNFLNGTGAYRTAPAEVEISAVSRNGQLDFRIFYRGTLAGRGAWSWKKATTIEDALNFLNGAGAYKTPPRKALVCAVTRGTSEDYYLFYQR